MKELTRAEEQIMRVLWQLEKGVVHDIIAKIKEPKPAYNTVSTIVRILEKKGFVSHISYGRTHQYFPIIAESDYKTTYFNNFLGRYFENSFNRMASFFAQKEDMTITELEEVKRLIEVEISKKKGAGFE